MALKSSWTRGASLSTTRYEPMYDVLATVYPQSSEQCPALANPVYRWVLLDHTQGFSGPDSTMIVKFLEGEVGLTLKSYPKADFRNLRSGGMYSFGLLVAYENSVESFDTIANLLPLKLDAAEFQYSFAAYQTAIFTAVAPPRGGTVHVAPRMGGAVNEQFSIATVGWTDLGPADRAAPLMEYSFYRFPVATDASLAYDNTSHKLTCTGSCELPLMPQETLLNTSSPDYYVTRGGKMLTTWLPEGDMTATFPGGSYMTVAMVRDGLGGVSSAYVAGPLVTEIQDMTAEAVKDALAHHINAGDANGILNAAEALVGVSTLADAEQKEVLDAIIEALAVVAATIHTSQESVQKFGLAVQSLAEDGIGSFAQVKKVSDSLSTVVYGAHAQDEGISAQTGEGLVNAVSSLAIASSETTDATAEESGNVADQFVDTTATIGKGMAKDMEAGESRTIEGDGMVLQVEVIEPAAEGETSVLGGDVVVPADVDWGRRLQDSGKNVTRHALAVIVTDWNQNNIFFKTPQAYNVQKNADLKTVRVLNGNSLVTLTSPVDVVMHVQTPAAGLAPVCLWWNEQNRTWTEKGVATAPLVVHGSNDSVTCSSMHASGTYAVIFTNTSTDSTGAMKSSNDHTRGGVIGGFGGSSTDAGGMSARMLIVIVVLVLVFVACTVAVVAFVARTMRAGGSMKQPMVEGFTDIEARSDGATGHLPTGAINV